MGKKLNSYYVNFYVNKFFESFLLYQNNFYNRKRYRGRTIAIRNYIQKTIKENNVINYGIIYYLIWRVKERGVVNIILEYAVDFDYEIISNNRFYEIKDYFDTMFVILDSDSIGEIIDNNQLTISRSVFRQYQNLENIIKILGWSDKAEFLEKIRYKDNEFKNRYYDFKKLERYIMINSFNIDNIYSVKSEVNHYTFIDIIIDFKDKETKLLELKLDYDIINTLLLYSMRINFMNAIYNI